MTITELKNYIESVCLAHKEIKDETTDIPYRWERLSIPCLPRHPKPVHISGNPHQCDLWLYPDHPETDQGETARTCGRVL